MAGGTRDARRRRILAGSSDRLALITGHVQNISSASSESLPTDPVVTDDNASSQPFISGDADSKLHFYDPTSDKSLDNTFSKRDQADQPDRGNASVGGSREEPSLRRREMGRQNPSRTITTHHVSEVRSRAEPSSSVQRPSFPISNPEQLMFYLVNLFGSVTSQQLSSAVSATEHSRLSYSFAMAFLVLLSYVGFPLVGNKVIKSIILFRPFLFLLVTNIYVIVSRLLSEMESSDKDKDVNKSFGPDGIGWAEEAGRALEVGLMLKNVLGSLFMDFSVYAVTIICGFSLA